MLRAQVTLFSYIRLFFQRLLGRNRHQDASERGDCYCRRLVLDSYLRRNETSSKWSSSSIAWSLRRLASLRSEFRNHWTELSHLKVKIGHLTCSFKHSTHAAELIIVFCNYRIRFVGLSACYCTTSGCDDTRSVRTRSCAQRVGTDCLCVQRCCQRMRRYQLLNLEWPRASRAARRLDLRAPFHQLAQASGSTESLQTPRIGLSEHFVERRGSTLRSRLSSH